MCHGAQGMSDGNSPNLAGQYPEVIIKQLHDYKSGDRSSAFMQTIAQKLSDRGHPGRRGLLRLAAQGARGAGACR